ncbi:MAG: ABC-2 family transporter protein [Chlamydiia bacterium]
MGKYFFIFQLAIVKNIKNTKALVGLGLFLLTCMLIFAHLWEIAATKLGATKLDPDHLLWYIALNQWVLISIPDVHDDMEEDLKSGKLAYLLPRPISYLGSIFCEGLGTIVVNFTLLGFVALLFSWWRTEICPFDFFEFLIISGLGLFACIVGMLFQMIIGISAFWVREVTPCDWIWKKLLFAFGGLLLPLLAYPTWIQHIAYYTP